MSTAGTTTSEKNEYPKASNGLVFGAIVTFLGSALLLMAFCSPYWVESYPETYSSFKNMGLWEYCFKDFRFPPYQLPRLFSGCHNVFSHEYYVIREYLVPGWLICVQTFVTLSFILIFIALSILALEIMRWPLKCVLQYEWLLTRISFICVGTSSLFMFLAVAVFGGNAYRRDWVLNPQFNVLSWSYSLAVVSFMIFALAALVLRKESIKAYELRSEAKNLVMQMEMQEPGFQPPRPYQSRNLQGYI